jgi:hypothetical protein
VNMNVSIQMKSTKAWSSTHEFTFRQSPVPDFAIEKGTIELILGETDSTKKLLDLNWRLQFADKEAATKYFEQLTQLFDKLSTNKKLEHEEGEGEVAQFSTRNPIDTGVRDITLFLTKSPQSNKYEISLSLRSEFTE